jgi:NADH-quinone oxidoreductase subunit N
MIASLVTDGSLATLAQATVQTLEQPGGVAELMAEKLSYLVPEAILFVATCVAMVLGLSPKRSLRDATPAAAIIGLLAAGIAALYAPRMPGAFLGDLMVYAKVLVASVGTLLVLLVSGTVDRAYEAAISRGVPFDGIRSTRGEFYAFLLFSLTGLMLCASADDLIWLFLALELTSLPTYVMVSISTDRSRSQEAGIKYFFLGAFGAAIFLYGFALLYGAAGTTLLFGEPGVPSIAAHFAEHGLGAMGTLGMALAIIGICFKIAAVPMHFYTPDVYEGAATPVAAFLAFVPKTAGFIAIMLLVSTIGWGYGPDGGLPPAIHAILWVVAALTMTLGNVLALLQRSVKRMLAYSSIAHSGYMLVGVVAGPGDGDLASNGLAAVLFYLLTYGFMNLGAFGVLACLSRRTGDEIENVDDLRGLCKLHPLLGWTMVLCAASLLGLPPLLGFFGKLYLFTAGVAAGEYALVIILGVNSAIAAFYYLKLIGAPLLESSDEPSDALRVTGFPGRVVASVVSAASVVVLIPFASNLMRASDTASSPAASPTPAVSSEADTAAPARSEHDRREADRAAVSDAEG